MPAPQPRHCSACGGIFLPATDSDAVRLVCPHCAAAIVAGDCPLAEVPASVDQEDAMVPEEAARAARLAEIRYRQQRLLLAGLFIMALLAVGALAWRYFAPPPAEAPPTAAEAAQLPPEALNLATRALAAGSPQAQSAFVVDPERVAPVMDWISQRTPDVFRPVTVSGCRSFRFSEIAGRSMLLLQLEITGERDRWVWLQQQPAGWRLDWESYVNPGHLQWREFLRSDPGTEIECRLLLSRHHTTPSWLAAAGQPDQPAVTLRAEMRPGAPVAIALAPATDPLWEATGPLEWGSWLQCIARVRLVSRDCDPPHVTILSILQHGWLHGADLRKFRDASLVLPPEAEK